MIKEQYVSFEIAKLLNEKGFQVDTDKDYWKIGEDGTMYFMCSIGAYTSDPNNKNAFYRPASSYPCPTQSVAMKWLREVHHIHVCPVYNAFFQERPKKVYHHWCCNAVGIGRCFRHGVQDIRMLDSDYFFFRSCKTYHDTYEDACEETIEYCLKHLID